MSALTAYLLGWAAFAPALAPVPLEPPPDPLAKGYLGIWFATSAGPNGSLTIDKLEPNQPASKAGLRTGDVIVRVNALHPQTTQDVISHVCTFRPGAVVEIEVARGAERKTYRVKLATRPVEGSLSSPEGHPVLPFEPVVPFNNKP